MTTSHSSTTPAGGAPADGLPEEPRGLEAPAQPSPLPPAERGRTVVADRVVERLAARAARRAQGVLDDERDQVAVEVGEREAAVDVEVVARYDQSLRRVGNEVRQRVASAVEDVTGLQVTEVNVSFTDVARPRRLQDVPAPIRRLQARRESFRQRSIIYRTAWVVAGVIVLLTGLAATVLPGPAFLIIPLGLAMLSLQFAWAGRLLELALERGAQARDSAGDPQARRRILRLAAVAAAVAAVVALVVVLLL